MTVQAFCFLIRAKRVQRSKELAVRVDDGSRTMQTVSLSGKEIKASVAKVKETSSEMYPMLQYLQNKGHVIMYGRKTFSLTHSGFFYVQSIVSDIVSFLFKSIIVPIVVSVVTTLIALWLNNPSTP